MAKQAQRDEGFARSHVQNQRLNTVGNPRPDAQTGLRRCPAPPLLLFPLLSLLPSPFPSSLSGLKNAELERDGGAGASFAAPPPASAPTHSHPAEGSGCFHERRVSLVSHSRRTTDSLGAWLGCSPRALGSPPAPLRAGPRSPLEPLGRGLHSCIPSAGPATIGPRCISAACLCAGSRPPANGVGPSVQIPARTHPTRHGMGQPDPPLAFPAREEGDQGTISPLHPARLSSLYLPPQPPHPHPVPLSGWPGQLHSDPPS